MKTYVKLCFSQIYSTWDMGKELSLLASSSFLKFKNNVWAENNRSQFTKRSTDVNNTKGREL